VAALEQRLTAKRIYQDLVVDHGFTGSYWAVNRYVKCLEKKDNLPFRRIETAPGYEAQIDLGKGALQSVTTQRSRGTLQALCGPRFIHYS
jgi:hypothetical protein